MDNQIQRLAAVFLLGFLVTSCNIPSSSITVTPTNSPAPSVTAAPTPIPGPNENIVIAQLNLWYFGSGCNGGFEAFDCSGKRTTPFTPALGFTYTSSDPSVIRQQIDWAADYGVDAFSLEWTTPRGVGNSLENNIDDAFLKAPNLSRIRWCIFYDTALRIMQDPSLSFANGTNFDDPKIYNAFVSDFDHFAAKYFNQPQYLKIDGRPVINIYVSWQFTGNFQGAIRDARARAAARGFDVYMVGEEMRADHFLPKHIQYFDAATSFNFATPGVPDQPDMGKEAVVLDQFFRKWKDEIKDIKVFGRSETVGLEPSFGAQEDSRLFAPPSNQIYVPALSKDQVTAMAEVARDDAVPVGSLNQKLIWVNTWNDWAEATTIEPTITQGSKYPAGNYGFDFLEVMRDVFGAKTFSN